MHVIPSAQPPHRDRPQVSAERRMDWVRLALQHEPSLVADDRELRRSGPSYTYDTLAQLRSELPDASLILLLGDGIVPTPELMGQIAVEGEPVVATLADDFGILLAVYQSLSSEVEKFLEWERTRTVEI